MSESEDPVVRNYVLPICDPCVAQEGEQCHTPGCVFIRRNVAERGWPLRSEGDEFGPHLFPTLEEYLSSEGGAAESGTAAPVAVQP